MEFIKKIENEDRFIVKFLDEIRIFNSEKEAEDFGEEELNKLFNYFEELASKIKNKKTTIDELIKENQMGLRDYIIVWDDGKILCEIIEYNVIIKIICVLLFLLDGNKNKEFYDDEKTLNDILNGFMEEISF